MKECLGKYFIYNGLVKECQEFDPFYLDDPYYIYEVLRVIESVPLFIEDHHQRLLKTAAHTGLSTGLIPQDLPKMISKLIHTNKFKQGNIKIVIHKGRQPIPDKILQIFITGHQYPTAKQFQYGVQVALIEGIRDNPNAKVMDVSLRNKANEIKQQKQVYETLLIDNDCCITEGSRSNVFFVKNNELITPPLSDVLPGVTRKHILDVCEKNCIAVREEKVLVKELEFMDAVFISGTSRKVLPVKAIGELTYNVDHTLIRQVQHLFNEEVKQYITSQKK